MGRRRNGAASDQQPETEEYVPGHRSALASLRGLFRAISSVFERKEASKAAGRVDFVSWGCVVARLSVSVTGALERFGPGTVVCE